MRFIAVSLTACAWTEASGLAATHSIFHDGSTLVVRGTQIKRWNGLLQARNIDNDNDNGLNLKLLRRAKGKKDRGKDQTDQGGGGEGTKSTPKTPNNTPQSSIVTSASRKTPQMITRATSQKSQVYQAAENKASSSKAQNLQASNPRSRSQSPTSKPDPKEGSSTPASVSTPTAKEPPKRKTRSYTSLAGYGSGSALSATLSSPREGRRAKSGVRTLTEASAPGGSRSASPNVRYSPREAQGGAHAPISEAISESISEHRARASKPITKPTNFQGFLNHNKDILAHARDMSPTSIRPPQDIIDDAKAAKTTGREARALARQRLHEANAVASTHSISSPTTRRAMDATSAASRQAVSATSSSSRAQQYASRDLISTSAHGDVVGYVKSAAREYKRAQQLQSHHLAFAKQDEAELLAATVPKKGPTKKRAELKANGAKLAAGRLAKEYYENFDQYRITRDEFSSGSSSSDSERPIKGYPREDP